MFVKLVSKESKYYYYILISSLFIITGYIIAIIAIFIGSYYQLATINHEFDVSANNTLAYKQKFLKSQIENFKNYISAIDKTVEFKVFLENEKKDLNQETQHIQSLMMAITRANTHIYQFRFIDENGFEKIRIHKNSVYEQPYIQDGNLLQNKANRYYFRETKNLQEGKLWFSNLDLNMEHGKIEKPIVPTLRIAKPYFIDGNFKGMLIINIFMKNILQNTIESEPFIVSVVDKDAYILTSNKKNAKEWTRYLLKDKGFKCLLKEKETVPLFFSLFFVKKYKILKLSDIINNHEGLHLVLEQRTEKIEKYTNTLVEYMLVMVFIVFIVSFPIVAILARYPIKLHNELKKYKETLENKMEILDQYVYMTTTDTKGVIIDVSTAYTKLSGYTKEQLIGQSHNILRNPKTPSSLYKELWETIVKGESWSGEIQNINKSGEVFTIQVHIAPVIEEGKTVAYTSIRENITDQKIIEEISIRDELTQVYNRRFFNQVFPRELKRLKRHDGILCIAMLDIDYFKKYNDTYGHIQGDIVLQQVSHKLNSQLQREGDYLFRVGGEEFIILCLDMLDTAKAQEFSSTLVASIESLQIEHSQSLTSDVVTISIGATSLSSSSNMEEKEILEYIDKLLYEAKANGRNQSVFSES